MSLLGRLSNSIGFNKVISCTRLLVLCPCRGGEDGPICTLVPPKIPGGLCKNAPALKSWQVCRVLGGLSERGPLLEEDCAAVKSWGVQKCCWGEILEDLQDGGGDVSLGGGGRQADLSQGVQGALGGQAAVLGPFHPAGTCPHLPIRGDTMGT